MPPHRRSASGVVCGVIVFLLFNLSPLTVVGTGERGVVLNWGAYSGQMLEPGLHWRTPIVQRIVKIDVQIQKDESQAQAASKDLNNVKTQVAVNYHLDPASAGTVYQNIGIDYAAKMIDPAIQESVKATTAKYTAEELVTQRELAKQEIIGLLKARLTKYNIIVDEVSITNFDFSPEFSAAIEKKVQAEQDALAAKNKLDQVKYEAQQQIETAKAQAETIKIQAAAVNAQGGADYVKLQAIKQWDGKLPTQMIPNASLPFLDVTK